MIITQQLQHKRLVRMRDLAIHFQDLLPPATGGFINELGSAVTLTATLAGQQQATQARARKLADAKRSARTALRADLVAINLVAAAVSLRMPEFDRGFQTPTAGDGKLLAFARA